MKPPKILRQFERNRQTFNTWGDSMTHQSHQKECDINQIMLRWQKTGVIDHANTYQGQYGDFSEVPNDYQEAMNRVINAQDMFMSLPSSIRKQFNNDPGQFLDFATDPKNADRMVELGLSAPEVVESSPTTSKSPQIKKNEIEDPKTPPEKGD